MEKHSIDFWYQKIIEEKESQSALNALLGDTEPTSDFQNLLKDLTSKSRVSVWGLFAYIVAYAYTILEGFMIVFERDVEAKANAAVYANDEWWVKKAKEYQDGDESFGVKLVNGLYQLSYASTNTPTDEANRVIKFAAIKNSNGASIIKIAGSVGGKPAKLSADVVNRFKGYRRKLQPAGVNVSEDSRDADLMRYKILVYHDGLANVEDRNVPNSDLDLGLKTKVTNAINDYHANLSFDGEVSLTSLVDYIQKIEKVKDVIILEAFGKPEGGVYGRFNAVYESAAGFVKIGNVVVFPTPQGVDDTQIEFIAK